MAQRSSRKRRKERPRGVRGAGAVGPLQRDGAAAKAAPDYGDDSALEPAAGSASMARGYARGRARDEAARAQLVPLAPGERPLAVTVAGVLAFVLGLVNLVAYLAGGEIQGERPSPIGIGLFTLVMMVAAYGCFRVRYWAVLGVQLLLGLLIVIFCLVVIGASNLATFVICLAVIVPSGVLFWFLVKAMARIQMPERPGAGS